MSPKALARRYALDGYLPVLRVWKQFMITSAERNPAWLNTTATTTITPHTTLRINRRALLKPPSIRGIINQAKIAAWVTTGMSITNTP